MKNKLNYNSLLEGRDQRMSALTKVLSFTSGKGGVGKTNCVANVALSLAALGNRVLILDADLSLANVDIIMNAGSEKNISHVISGECELEDTICQVAENVSLLPASSGVESLSKLSDLQRRDIFHWVEKAAQRFDYLLIDTPAGVGPDVLFLNSAAHNVICIVQPEPTSFTDAYALLKILYQNYNLREAQILINRVGNQEEGEALFRRFLSTTQRYLPVRLECIGVIPEDRQVIAAIQARVPVVKFSPSAPAALAFMRVADRLEKEIFRYETGGGLKFFFAELMQGDAELRSS